jgi:hypothetical protein
LLDKDHQKHIRPNNYHPAASQLAMQPVECVSIPLCLRLQVMDISMDSHRRIKHLRCSQNPSSASIIIVELSDDWFDCDISGGDVFHLVDMQEPQLKCTSSMFELLEDIPMVTVNASRGLVVVLPDSLVSPTKIADSWHCLR